MNFYRLKKPFYALSEWYKLQKQIYSIPRAERPIFWEIQQHMEICKAHMAYDLGVKMFGDYQSQKNPKELNGLEGIIND